MLKRKIHDIIYCAKPKKSKEADPESDEEVLKALGEILGPVAGSRHSDKKITRDINHIYYHSEVDRDSVFDLCELILNMGDDSDSITIIEGAVASAGTLISVFGKKRYIRPHAYMLIHQLSSGFWGKMSEIDDEYKNLSELTDRILSIYKENTKIPKKELQELLKHDLWLNVEKALKYGLVDDVYQ